jgi:hypothetical protein
MSAGFKNICFVMDAAFLKGGKKQQMLIGFQGVWQIF